MVNLYVGLPDIPQDLDLILLICLEVFLRKCNKFIAINLNDDPGDFFNEDWLWLRKGRDHPRNFDWNSLDFQLRLLRRTGSQDDTGNR